MFKVSSINSIYIARYTFFGGEDTKVSVDLCSSKYCETCKIVGINKELYVQALVTRNELTHTFFVTDIAPPLRIFAPPLKSHMHLPLGKFPMIDQSENLTFLVAYIRCTQYVRK